MYYYYEFSFICKSQNGFKCKSIDPFTASDQENWVTVGHMPKEVSRHIHFFLKLGGKTTITVFDTKFHKSLTVLKGLEILLEVTFSIISEKHNMDILKRLKTHINTNYKNPVQVTVMPDTSSNNPEAHKSDESDDNDELV